MKVLIVDDSPVVRHSIRLLFETDEDFEVCGEAEDGREAIEKTSKLRPELVIMDLSMPVLNGLDARRAIRRIQLHVPVVLFSGFSSALEEREAQSVGISALVSNQTCQALRPTRCGEQIRQVSTTLVLNRAGNYDFRFFC